MASDRSGISEIAAMTTEIIGGYVRNPNTNIAKDDLIPFIKEVHETMTGIVQGDLSAGLVQRVGAPAPSAMLPAPARADHHGHGDRLAGLRRRPRQPHRRQRRGRRSDHQ